MVNLSEKKKGVQLPLLSPASEKGHFLRGARDSLVTMPRDGLEGSQEGSVHYYGTCNWPPRRTSYLTTHFQRVASLSVIMRRESESKFQTTFRCHKILLPSELRTPICWDHNTTAKVQSFWVT